MIPPILHYKSIICYSKLIKIDICQERKIYALRNGLYHIAPTNSVMMHIISSQTSVQAILRLSKAY